jgi:hypothetical protein
MELDADYDPRTPNTYSDYIVLRSSRRAARFARERAMQGLPTEVEAAAASGDRERNERFGELQTSAHPERSSRRVAAQLDSHLRQGCTQLVLRDRRHSQA